MSSCSMPMPLLPNGKIDRKSLPAPDLDARSEELVLPRNDLERAVAASMAQVLGLPQIGIHDNFFSLGGHSLLAAQLTSRLNRELGSALTLRALFDGPTVAGLAEIASGTLGAPARKAIERQADQSSAPLSLMQERLWLLEQFTPGQVTYNTPSGHRLRGPLDVAVFVRAFDALVQRQSVLRTSIGTLGGEAFQVIHDSVDSGLLPVVDLGALPAETARGKPPSTTCARWCRRRSTSTRRRCSVRGSTSWPTTSTCCSSCRTMRSGMAGRSTCCIRDLSEFYAAFLEGREPDLPALPVSYGDFSIWHREWIEGPEYAKQREFWRERLGSDRGTGEQAMRAMPTDMPRKPGMSGGSSQFPIAIPRDLSDQLHADRAEAGLDAVRHHADGLLRADVRRQRPARPDRRHAGARPQQRRNRKPDGLFHQPAAAARADRSGAAVRRGAAQRQVGAARQFRQSRHPPRGPDARVERAERRRWRPGAVPRDVLVPGRAPAQPAVGQRAARTHRARRSRARPRTWACGWSRTNAGWQARSSTTRTRCSKTPPGCWRSATTACCRRWRAIRRSRSRR